MITTALLGLALAAAPVEDIAAQFGTETQATNVSCTSYDVTYCYGMGRRLRDRGDLRRRGVHPARRCGRSCGCGPDDGRRGGSGGCDSATASGSSARTWHRATTGRRSTPLGCSTSATTPGSADLSARDGIEDYHESGEGEQVLVTIAEGDSPCDQRLW